MEENLDFNIEKNLKTILFNIKVMKFGCGWYQRKMCEKSI